MQERTWIAPNHCRGLIRFFGSGARKIHQRGKDMRLAHLLLQLNDLCLQFRNF